MLAVEQGDRNEKKENHLVTHIALKSSAVLGDLPSNSRRLRHAGYFQRDTGLYFWGGPREVRKSLITELRVRTWQYQSNVDVPLAPKKRFSSLGPLNTRWWVSPSAVTVQVILLAEKTFAGVARPEFVARASSPRVRWTLMVSVAESFAAEISCHASVLQG